MKDLSGTRIVDVAQIDNNIIKTSKLTVYASDKKLLVRDINLANAAVVAAVIEFDSNVIITNAQTGQQEAVVSAGSNPVISLFNNDLTTLVGTIIIDKSAAQLEKDNCSALSNTHVAGGHSLNVEVTTHADTSGKCTLTISYMMDE